MYGLPSSGQVGSVLILTDPIWTGMSRHTFGERSSALLKMASWQEVSV
jgi:hypothetical protein